jgi:hypothetical protein
MRTNFKNVKPDFPASLGARGESVKAGKVQILSISSAINNPLSGWDGKKVVVVELEHRLKPVLTTANLFKGSYELSLKETKSLPELEVNNELNPELSAGMKDGIIFFRPSTS